MPKKKTDPEMQDNVAPEEVTTALPKQTDTLVSVETDCQEPLLLDEMEQWEKEWLDGYHRTVYRALSPLLDEQTRAWLYEATLPVCG